MAYAGSLGLSVERRAGSSPVTSILSSIDLSRTFIS